MPKDIYLQPDAPDPLLSNEVALALVRRHVPTARRVTSVDESGGEARTYMVDENIVLKVQRPPQLRPRTSLEKETFFLKQLAADPNISVPKVLGYGREDNHIEYICMTRIPGVAMNNIQVAGPARQAALMALGRTLRYVHQMPQAPFAESELFPGDRTSTDFRARLTELFGEVAATIRDERRAWSFSLRPEILGDRALAALPSTDEFVALHSNPGPEHVFVSPGTGEYTGLIDFGDAYISHPALDLRRWRDPADRAILFASYTADQSVSEHFLSTWRVLQILANMVAIAFDPARNTDAYTDLAQFLDRS